MSNLAALKRIDAHCHVHFPAYGDEREAVIARALADGTGMVCVGTELGTSEGAVAVAEAHDGLWAAVGFHPSHLHPTHHDDEELGDRPGAASFDIPAFRRLIRSSRKVVGIGECGLDRHHLPTEITAEGIENERREQKELFRQHIELALEFDLPVIVHCRDLHDEACTIIREYHDAGRPVRGVAHCFTGDRAAAKLYLDLGFYVSFAGTVTYKPRAADRATGETPEAVLKTIPLDRLIIETDAPYLAPGTRRGQRNEPAFVKEVGEKVAELLDLPIATIEDHSRRNTIALFSLA
jgi:TatD DNase family protein